MSKIEEQKGRDTKNTGDSGYTRVIGNKELGQLLSKVQACLISNGTELERLLIKKCKTIENIDAFIEEVEKGDKDNGTYLCTKNIIRQTQKYTKQIKGIEPDMIIFIVSNHRVCKIIELKDGDTFDTKKVKGEKQNLEEFTEKFGAKIPFSADYYICCFNQNDKNIIKTGMKNVFELEHIMTGKELCELLNIDYNEIINMRQADVESNFDYFVKELLKIKQVKDKIKYLLEND